MARVVGLEIGGLIREQRVGRRVRLREAVAGEVLDVLEDLGGLLLRNVSGTAAADERVALRLHLRGVLLAHRAPQLVGLAQRKPGKLAGQPHDLLLVRDDAVRLAEERLHLRQVVLHVDPAVLSRDVVVHDAAAKRTGPIERVERDQVLETLRFGLTQRVAHPRAFELEDTVRLAVLEELVALRRRRAGSPSSRWCLPSSPGCV